MTGGLGYRYLEGTQERGSSEEDTDEGGYGDVQESRWLQSTPVLDTQSQDNHRRTRIAFQVRSMPKSARTIAKRTRITKSMDTAAFPRVW